MNILLPVILFFSLNLMADLKVHEWGSINIVTGQENVIVGNIADDQSDLPDFVEVWSEQAQIRPIMIEKPILYFYTDQKISATVNVSYPNGLFTQWWPKPVSFLPMPPRNNAPQPKEGGHLSWRVMLDPNADADNQLPLMENHPWWPIARDVDAATVNNLQGDAEKFLFYRGAGTFTPTLNVSVNEKGEFQLSNKENTNSREVYTIRVQEGRDPEITYIPSLTAEKTTFRNADEAAKHLQARLENKGLYAKEAAGMVKIWKTAMFEETGYRAMYMMEQKDIDKMIPLTVVPEPDEQVRVMLIRFECLGPDRKKQIEGWITQLGAMTYRDRKQAQEELMKTGRIGEALMRTEYEKTRDPEVKTSLRKILKAITPRNPNP